MFQLSSVMLYFPLVAFPGYALAQGYLSSAPTAWGQCLSSCSSSPPVPEAVQTCIAAGAMVSPTLQLAHPLLWMPMGFATSLNFEVVLEKNVSSLKLSLIELCESL